MVTYIVTFEISKQDVRLKVQEKLKESGFYCPIQKDAWAIRSEKKAAQLRDELIQLIAAGDIVFVIRSGVEAAWNTTYGTENSEWLKKYL